MIHYILKNWGVFTRAIEKKYYNNKSKIYCKARYIVDGTYGYAILAYSMNNNFEWLSPYLDSFETNVPFFTNYMNRMAGNKSKDSSEIVFNLITAIILFAIPVGFGVLRYATRESFLGLILIFMLPLCLSGFLLYEHFEWWKDLGAGAICMALMGAGRFGLFMWVD